MGDLLLDQVLARDAEWRYWFTLCAAHEIGELAALADETHWMLVARADRLPLFPVWPTYEIAELCSRSYWPVLRPGVFELDDECGEWFDVLERRGTPIEVFPTGGSPGLQVTPAEVMQDLELLAVERAGALEDGTTMADPRDRVGSPLADWVKNAAVAAGMAKIDKN